MLARVNSSPIARPRRSFLGALRDEVWQVLLPQRCIACGEFGAALHEACLDQLPVADGARCDRCWRPDARLDASGRCERCLEASANEAGFDALRTAFRFDGLARRALLEAKFRGVTAHLDPLGQVDSGEACPQHDARGRGVARGHAQIETRHVARGSRGDGGDDWRTA